MKARVLITGQCTCYFKCIKNKELLNVKMSAGLEKIVTLSLFSDLGTKSCCMHSKELPH